MYLKGVFFLLLFTSIFFSVHFTTFSTNDLPSQDSPNIYLFISKIQDVTPYMNNYAKPNILSIFDFKFSISYFNPEPVNVSYVYNLLYKPSVSLHFTGNYKFSLFTPTSNHCCSTEVFNLGLHTIFDYESYSVPNFLFNLPDGFYNFSIRPFNHLNDLSSTVYHYFGASLNITNGNTTVLYDVNYPFTTPSPYPSISLSSLSFSSYDRTLLSTRSLNVYTSLTILFIAITLLYFAKKRIKER